MDHKEHHPKENHGKSFKCGLNPATSLEIFPQTHPFTDNHPGLAEDSCHGFLIDVPIGESKRICSYSFYDILT